MKRIQFVLSLILLITLTTCQSDVKVDAPKKIAARVIPTVLSEEPKEEVEAEVAVAETDAEPKLLEFYVEEDKAATAKEKEAVAAVKKTKPSTKTTKKKTSSKSKSKKRPKMKFDDDTFAFGVIKPGEVIEHKFEFTNTGETDLVITDAKATCGCTQPSFPFVPIPPGEKGFIGVKYDSTGKLGSQKPTVTLTTNAYPAAQKVYLEGLVISEMSKN